MLSLTQILIDNCVERLQAGYHRTYGVHKPEYSDLIGWVANFTLGKIANSNAAYHNVEHTILVTLAGQAILLGKHTCEGSVSCEDWLHTIVSLLCHDIGFVRGICRFDRVSEGLYTTGRDGTMISLPPNSTDASLAPYHVDRGQLFVEEQFCGIELIDVEVIKRNIELTRFPVPPDDEHKDTLNYPGLTRAADLIGQLSDPQYLQKMTALFCEFEETGVSKSLGYHHSGDLRAAYPKFFWNVIYPYIRDGVSYLEVIHSGEPILANLYKNVRIVEQELLLSVPQSA
jgi:hypothetical protein